MSALAEVASNPPATPIRAVGVVVPARDEQSRVSACLTSIRHALAVLPAAVEVAVAIVLDRCVDATPDRVAALVADWPEAVAVPVVDAGPPLGPTAPPAAAAPVPTQRLRGSGVGAVRDLGVRTVLRRLHRHRPAATWLLSTDADTVVPVDWALHHLQFAHEGAHGVAGLADLVGAEHLAADALRRYRAIVRRGLHGDSHEHVYGANLGVRADAYLAVGGFPPEGAGEDHGLWQRLRSAGRPLAQPVGLRVRTSARLRGRADDGLAGLLRSLHHTPAHPALAHPAPAHPAPAHPAPAHPALHPQSGGSVRGGA